MLYGLCLIVLIVIFEIFRLLIVLFPLPETLCLFIFIILSHHVALIGLELAM